MYGASTNYARDSGDFFITHLIEPIFITKFYDTMALLQRERI